MRPAQGSALGWHQPAKFSTLTGGTTSGCLALGQSLAEIVVHLIFSTSGIERCKGGFIAGLQPAFAGGASTQGAALG